MKKLVLVLAASLCWMASAESRKSACSSVDEYTAQLSSECSQEIHKAIFEDKLARAVSDAVQNNAPVDGCTALPADQLEWKYQFSDAVGAYIDVSAHVSCESGEGIAGYSINGEYYHDGAGYFQFISVKMSTFE